MRHPRRLDSVDNLFFFLMGVCGSVGVTGCRALDLFLRSLSAASRRVGNPPAVNQSHARVVLDDHAVGNFRRLFAWGGEVYMSAYIPPEDATPIYVVAKQWMWKFQHPEGQREIDTLHVPVGGRSSCC